MFEFIKEINYLHLLLAVLGLLIHTVMKMIKVKTKKKAVWSFGYWIQDNWIETILSLLIIITVIVANIDGSVHGIIPVTNVTAIFLGYGAQSFFHNLIKASK
jgi:xanthine/uracil/vitamin C permease (AzgA family)